MFNVTVIYLGTNDAARANQKVAMNDGETVSQALTKAGVPTQNVHVKVNRVDANLEDQVGPNDSITVTVTNLKGAGIEFEDILAWGKAPVAIGDDVVAKAMAKRAEKGAEAHVEIVDELVDVMQREAETVNAQIARAEKALADARDQEAQLKYASEQLSKGNIFSLLGFAGLKHLSPSYSSRMGCACPANNSTLYATSPPKAAKE
jgi:hypothetical protein